MGKFIYKGRKKGKRMAITYQEKDKIISLQTENSTYQMKISEYGHLLHVYYGGKADGNMDYLVTYYDRGFSGNPYETGSDRTYSLDVLPQEFSSFGNGDYRKSAFIVQNSDGTECCNLHYVRHEIQKGKYGLSGLPAVYASEAEADTLIIYMEDSISRVQVQLLYGVLEKEDIITRSVRIQNQGAGKLIIRKAMSASLDFTNGSYDCISFHGKHMLERNLQRKEIGYGCFEIGSCRGTSSHQYNPGVIIADKNATEDAGDCYGMLFVYSGNFLFEAQKDQFGQTRVLMGLQSDLFDYTLEEGEDFIVPETILTYSSKGFSELSKRYHNCIREHICRGKYQKQVRPVLINSWEAAYFDFTGDTILELARDASELGIDMVVMDDGWFGKRNDDNTSLGDWVVNEEKLGCTLGELIQKINALDMKFGIWIEPEMVSEDSDLYREHPDWAITIPGRKPIRGRNQLVLDFSRAEVRDYIFDSICKVLNQGNVEYVKWDMNRSLSDIYSADREMGKVSYDYMLGVYDFAEKLMQRYPNLLIEGCSGGGGRFDAGMLYYTPQIWCSDNTDAIDRTYIQYGTSFFYPVSTVGSHVSASPNHQTGRSTSLHTRGVVAMAGTFGYEFNLKNLNAEEKEEIKEQIKTYKSYAELIQTGDYYRLSNPFKSAYAGWQFVSKDKKRTLLNVVMLETHANAEVHYVKLKGLEEDVIYEDTKTGKSYYGSALMKAGIPLPKEQGEYLAYQMELIVG